MLAQPDSKATVWLLLLLADHGHVSVLVEVELFGRFGSAGDVGIAAIPSAALSTRFTSNGVAHIACAI
jgi:hypothetical protein